MPPSALVLPVFDGEILPRFAQESKWVSTGRDFRLTIKKVDEADEHWPRLIAETGKLERIQVDWSRYVDEDEEDQIGADGGGGFGATARPP